MLYGLSKKVSRSLFLNTIKRASVYQVASIEKLERIITQLMKNSLYSPPDFSGNDDYTDRAEYQEGRFSKESDISPFENREEDNPESS